MTRSAVATSAFDGGVRALANQLAEGRTTPGELLERCLLRIAEADDAVGAFTWLNPQARVEAELLGAELKSGRGHGPLHGIPIAVKELFDVAGAPSTYGSLVLEPIPAAEDAHIVRRLREAGAVIVGTTRSHEFGWGITTQHHSRGSTRNPWDLDRVPGGSSGGSAAAVAAGMVPLAIASDTGGSIRIPAAFCGVAGIKPTYGRISKRGGVSLAPSLDTPGFIGRSVLDLFDALVAASGLDPDDPTTVIAGLPELSHVEASKQVRANEHPLAGVRLGHSPDLFELTAMTDRNRDYAAALSWAVDLGAELVELDLPNAGEFRTAFATIQMADAVTVHRDVLGTYPARGDSYGPDVLSRLEAASAVSVSDLLGAVQRARILHARLLSGMESVDALLSPISTVAPPLVADPDNAIADGRSIPLREAIMGFTTPQNLTGLPSVAFPFGLSADGLPVGFQITSNKGNEIQALRIAAHLERIPTPHTTNEEGKPR